MFSQKKWSTAFGKWPRSVRPLRRALLLTSLLLLFAMGTWFGIDRYHRNGPRRNALTVIAEIDRALKSGDFSQMMPLLELSPTAAARSPEERMQWVSDLLRDEVSAAGLDEFRRYARFGTLAEVFPDEAKRWADAASVAIGDCVAFRMERDGLRAEVVLNQTSTGFRVLRCNNVKQMALAAVPKS